MQNYKLPKVPENVSLPFNEICSVLADICEEKLTQEFFSLSIELALKLARKRPSPLLSGNPKTWAAGIIHTLGLVNFLFDKTQIPYLSSKDLCAWFDLGKSTINAKSQVIREMFKIYQMDPKWCLPSKLIDNPLVWMVLCDGYIVDARELPEEMQIEAYHAGVIPFVPNKND